MSIKKKCSVRGCDRLEHARGYCATHYSNWYRHNDVFGKKASRQRTESIGGKIATLKTDLLIARDLYGKSVGVEARIRRWREIRELESQLAHIETERRDDNGSDQLH